MADVATTDPLSGREEVAEKDIRRTRTRRGLPTRHRVASQL